MTGSVTIKMISNTSMTSINGVMLISFMMPSSVLLSVNIDMAEFRGNRKNGGRWPVPARSRQ
jgi:hypothetical protein